MLENRWWIYQRERFPICAHAPLVFVFSFSAVCYSSLARGSAAWPSLQSVATAFVVCLLCFLLLRIADEFKDAEEDARFRPYRPVPRGLVRLPELGCLGVIAASLQMGLSCLLRPGLGMVLLIVWGYFALMTREFFVRTWLRRRPVIYMLSHMLIVPLVDLYATACDWLTAGSSPPNGLFWFLSLGLANGIVLEVGRKIRAPAEEEPGVETYSAVWGRRRAVRFWLCAVAVSFVIALLAAHRIGHLALTACVLALPAVSAVVAAVAFIRSQTPGRHVEVFSVLWLLALYLAVGAVPRLVGM